MVDAPESDSSGLEEKVAASAATTTTTAATSGTHATQRSSAPSEGVTLDTISAVTKHSASVAQVASTSSLADKIEPQLTMEVTSKTTQVSASLPPKKKAKVAEAPAPASNEAPPPALTKAAASAAPAPAVAVSAAPASPVSAAPAANEGASASRKDPLAPAPALQKPSGDAPSKNAATTGSEGPQTIVTGASITAPPPPITNPIAPAAAAAAGSAATAAAAPPTAKGTNKPVTTMSSTQLLLPDYTAVRQTVKDLLALLQLYGPLTANQLEYNLPPVQPAAVPWSIHDVLNILVAIDLVQEVQGTGQYCMQEGIPRADAILPAELPAEIQQAHEETENSWKRCQILRAALLEEHPKNFREVLKQILKEYPGVMQDPVYWTAMRNCHIDTHSSTSGTAERRHTPKSSQSASDGGIASASSKGGNSSKGPPKASPTTATSKSPPTASLTATASNGPPNASQTTTTSTTLGASSVSIASSTPPVIVPVMKVASAAVPTVNITQPASTLVPATDAVAPVSTVPQSAAVPTLKPKQPASTLGPATDAAASEATVPQSELPAKLTTQTPDATMEASEVVPTQTEASITEAKTSSTATAS